MGLYEPAYTLRLTFISGANSELDYFFFDSVVPVEQSSWGAVKTLYRD